MKGTEHEMADKNIKRKVMKMTNKEALSKVIRNSALVGLGMHHASQKIRHVDRPGLNSNEQSQGQAAMQKV